MRRSPLLLAAGALWLFLAAAPALADGGPHVVQPIGSAGGADGGHAGGLSASTCAGCHQVHIGQGSSLEKATDRNALCLTCHGAPVAGATTDVVTGVQYQLAGAGPGTLDVQLGALRGGGFGQARIGEPTRLDGPMQQKVSVGPPAPVTSAHLELQGGVGGLAHLPKVAWGHGQNGSGVGPTVELSCVSCHNPHGNGQYRILRPIPHLASGGAGTPLAANLITYAILVSDPDTDRVYLQSTAPLMPGDEIWFSGHSAQLDRTEPAGERPAPTWTVLDFANESRGYTYITLDDGTGNPVDITASGTGGTLSKPGGMLVEDGPLPDGTVYRTRNYTVIDSATVTLLYAEQIVSPAAGSLRTDVVEIASSDAATNVITSAVAHGFAIGDRVIVDNHDGAGADGTWDVLAVPSTTTFTLDDGAGGTLDITTNGTNLGWVSRTYTVTSYAATDGDYFHRYSTWFGRLDGDDPVDTNPLADDHYFNDQITQWCSACHTRYYAQESPEVQVNISSISETTERITTATAHGLAVGNHIAIVGSDAQVTGPSWINGIWEVATVPADTIFTLVGADVVTAGTSVGQVLKWGPAYEAARPGDATYGFQHRTRGNRACTTCHVAHGSNVVMDGASSSTFTYPDGTASDSSRLLKVDNRGTCQLCHDPTETSVKGWFLGPLSIVTSQ